MTNLPRVNKRVSVNAEQQVHLAAEATKIRDNHKALTVAGEPKRREALNTGPPLKDFEAAVACSCSCHPRAGDTRLHESGASCPCQLTSAERAESFEQLFKILDKASAEQESYENDLQSRSKLEAQKLQIELRGIGGAAPFVIRGVADGRGFYLRERHDLWSVAIASDDDPTADPWADDRTVIEVAFGESDALEKDGEFCPVRALEVAVNAVRIFLLRRVCMHQNALRFCPICGVETAQADAWRIYARDDT